MIAARQKSSILTERTERRFADIAALKNKGLPISAICRELGLAHNSVRRFYRAADATELPGTPRAGRPHPLDEFAEYIHTRRGDGQTPASVLYEFRQVVWPR
ncbi:hypothetical protein [Rhodococcus jostii]|uniref:hypothetical protein n=1 Tax=Rhodococcus jostii TaxID=132919 RepID=UPI00362D2979